MEEKTIQSLDDLFIYAYEVEQGISVLQPIRLDGDFSLRLHVKGDSWDKRIDERSAQYIISLENVRHTPCYTSFLQRIQAKAR